LRQRVLKAAAENRPGRETCIPQPAAPGYHGPCFGTGGYHARVDRPANRIRERWICGRCIRRGKNTIGANLNHDELHAELQFDLCELPIVMCGAGHAADRRSDSDQQRERKLVVPPGLHDPAASLSDDVRADIALAVS